MVFCTVCLYKLLMRGNPFTILRNALVFPFGERVLNIM